LIPLTPGISVRGPMGVAGWEAPQCPSTATSHLRLLLSFRHVI
jgi:hypothetical protein